MSTNLVLWMEGPAPPVSSDLLLCWVAADDYYVLRANGEIWAAKTESPNLNREMRVALVPGDDELQHQQRRYMTTDWRKRFGCILRGWCTVPRPLTTEK